MGASRRMSRCHRRRLNKRDAAAAGVYHRVQYRLGLSKSANPYLHHLKDKNTTSLTSWRASVGRVWTAWTRIARVHCSYSMETGVIAKIAVVATTNTITRRDPLGRCPILRHSPRLCHHNGLRPHPHALHHRNGKSDCVTSGSAVCFACQSTTSGRCTPCVPRGTTIMPVIFACFSAGLRSSRHPLRSNAAANTTAFHHRKTSMPPESKPIRCCRHLIYPSIALAVKCRGGDSVPCTIHIEVRDLLTVKPSLSRW